MISAHDRLQVLSEPDQWRHHQFVEGEDFLVLTPAGVFVARDEGEMRFWQPARYADFERMFGALATNFKGGGLELKKKIPYILLLQAINFFHASWQQHQTEDILLLYYYDDSRYELWHPPLISVSSGHVRYDWPATPDNAVRIGSLHSHGSAQAYHSSKDYADDVASPGVHVICGDLNRTWQSVLCMVSNGSTCYPVPLWDLFEKPYLPPFPPAWLVRNIQPESLAKHSGRKEDWR